MGKRRKNAAGTSGMAKAPQAAKTKAITDSTGGKKAKLFFLNLGKLILEATKLCFGSLVLGVVIRGEISQSTLLVSGIVASGIGALLGLFFLTMFEEK